MKWNDKFGGSVNFYYFSSHFDDKKEKLLDQFGLEGKTNNFTRFIIISFLNILCNVLLLERSEILFTHTHHTDAFCLNWMKNNKIYKKKTLKDYDNV